MRTLAIFGKEQTELNKKGMFSQNTGADDT